MSTSELKIIRNINDSNIEFITNITLEPNSSYEIKNCIIETISPLKKVEYNFDFWFDDNDSGYFIKDKIRVNIHYGVMYDFTFTVENKYSKEDLSKIEDWIYQIYSCMLQKEFNRKNNVSLPEITQKMSLNEMKKQKTYGNSLKKITTKIFNKLYQK